MIKKLALAGAILAALFVGFLFVLPAIPFVGCYFSFGLFC